MPANTKRKKWMPFGHQLWISPKRQTEQNLKSKPVWDHLSQALFSTSLWDILIFELSILIFGSKYGASIAHFLIFTYLRNVTSTRIWLALPGMARKEKTTEMVALTNKDGLGCCSQWSGTDEMNSGRVLFSMSNTVSTSRPQLWVGKSSGWSPPDNTADMRSQSNIVSKVAPHFIRRCAASFENRMLYLAFLYVSTDWLDHMWGMSKELLLLSSLLSLLSRYHVLC